SRPRTSSVPLSFFVLLSFSLPPFILLSSLLTPRPPISTLFPYTTLFRSSVQTGSLDGGGHFAFIECVTVFWGGDHWRRGSDGHRSEEHTSELQSRFDLVCRLLLEKKKKKKCRDELLTQNRTHNVRKKVQL